MFLYIYIKMEFFHFLVFFGVCLTQYLDSDSVMFWMYCMFYMREGLIVKREMFEFTADEMLWIKQSNPEYVSERSVTGSLLIMLFLSSDNKRFVL